MARHTHPDDDPTPKCVGVIVYDEPLGKFAQIKPCAQPLTNKDPDALYCEAHNEPDDRRFQELLRKVLVPDWRRILERERSLYFEDLVIAPIEDPPAWREKWNERKRIQFRTEDEMRVKRAEANRAKIRKDAQRVTEGALPQEHESPMSESTRVRESESTTRPSRFGTVGLTSPFQDEIGTVISSSGWKR